MRHVSGTPAAPHVYVSESANRGVTWSAQRAIESAGDRGLYTAPAIAPNRRDVYVVDKAFTTPFRTTASEPRTLVGVVKHADVAGGATRAFSELHRGAPGDPRGSSANALTSEFLGDYVYAVASRTYGAAVWNDAPRRGRLSRARSLAHDPANGGSILPPPAHSMTARPPSATRTSSAVYADPTP